MFALEIRDVQSVYTLSLVTAHKHKYKRYHAF